MVKLDKNGEDHASFLENKLDRLVYIYSVDTSSFYNDREYKLNKEIIKYNGYKNKLNDIKKPLISIKDRINSLMTDESLTEVEYEETLVKIEKAISKFELNNSVFNFKINSLLIFDSGKSLFTIRKDSILSTSETFLNKITKQLKDLLDQESEMHYGRRALREDALVEKNKVSLFESTLTRSLELNPNDVSKDLIVVRAYRYIVFDELIKKGFTYKGQKYIYFSSSAGQIRTKKSCFIRVGALRSNRDKVRNKLMCGLSIDKINRKGGINQNKFQAYLSLTNSASIKWDDFNIDRAIVVDDMELKLKGLVDFIDHEDYSITRKVDDVTINFVDGAGMCLPSISNKSFQFRMPFFKGLLVPFDFMKFVEQHPNANYKVKDIYNNEWDIKEDNIQIIFTKSQFKLYSFYNDWDEYKNYYKKFECESSICKSEESVFKDKPVNYQMIQSLSFSEDELKKLSKETVADIEIIGNCKETMLRLLGAEESNKKRNHYQEALLLYPSLLNDAHSKQTIKDRKKSLVKDAKSGRIVMTGTKRTYISPDFYAFCQWLFEGMENPTGLLNNGEVSCNLYDKQEINLLRSPHLFKEHCVRKNIINQKTDEWFITNDVYTSVKDMISTQLMFDVDGDDSLIVSNSLFVQRAKEEMKDIVPLKYELKKAKKSRISNENIASSLKAAYSKNIGEISNLITKIWSSKNPDLDLIKLLCMENNAIIDFAKSQWMPTRPDSIDKRIKKFSSKKVPFFFQYAKGKEKNKVDSINDCTMNKLTEIIPNSRINFKKVAGTFNYKSLMKNQRLTIEDDLSKRIIDTYEFEDKRKRKNLREQVSKQEKISNNVQLHIYKNIRKRLLHLTNDPHYITDVLVKYLFHEKESAFKDTLWNCFGKEIVRNIKRNVHSLVDCVDCSKTVNYENKQQIRCEECLKLHKRKLATLRKQRQRMSRKITG